MAPKDRRRIWRPVTARRQTRTSTLNALPWTSNGPDTTSLRATGHSTSGKNRSFFAHFVQKTRPYFSSVGGQLDPRRVSGKQTSGNRNMYRKYFSDVFTPFLTISHSPEGQSVFLTAIHIGSTPSFQHFHDCWNMLHSVFLLHSIIMRKWSDEFHTKLLKDELQIGSGNMALHLKNQMIAKLKWI